LNEATERASQAARDEVRRVARAVLSSGIGAIIRSLELAREVCGAKRWTRVIDLCNLAREQLAKVLTQPAADQSIQNELSDLLAGLLDCVNKVRRKQKDGSGNVPEGVLDALDQGIIALHRIDGRMTGIQAEAHNG
jgi:hypothetical protein